MIDPILIPVRMLVRGFCSQIHRTREAKHASSNHTFRQ
jgi:hypothetical protein